MRGTGTSFFQAPSYIQWVKALVAHMPARPGAVGLFDATMAEPTAILRDVVRQVLDEPGQPRLRSVMDSGNPLVIEALAARYGVGADQILCTTGALTGVSIVLKALLKPGDHILIERPHLDTLVEVAARTGAQIGYLDRHGDGGEIDPGQIGAKLRANTRLILLTNLHNPTGAFLSDAALRGVAGALSGHTAKILVDEVYADYVHRFEGGSPAVGLAGAFISVNSLSKVYGLSALKCGWIIADPATIARITPVHAREEFGVSKLTHAVASLVLEDETRFTDFVRATMVGARPAVDAWAEPLRREGLIDGRTPEAGCLYFPRLPGIEDTRAFAARLWREQAVAVAPGELFQRPGHIRLGFGRDPAALEPPLDKLAKTLRAVRDEASAKSVMTNARSGR